MRFYGIHLIFILLMIVNNLTIGQSHIKVNHIFLSKKESENKVYSIIQDSKGFMWFGTVSGLFKYDGYKFYQYLNDPKDSTSISNNYVLSLLEDNNGNIWCGTYSGLNKLDPRLNQFTCYKNNPEDSTSISNNYVWSIAQDNKGYLWLGTYSGLNRMDIKSGKFIHYRNNPNDINSLSNDYVWTIHIDKKETIWVGTYDGLNAFNPEKNAFTIYKSLADDPFSLSNNDVRAIYEDNEGNLWIGTYGGLNKFNPLHNKFYRYKNEPGNPNSLCNNSVRTIIKDSKGNLWVGTSGGINIYNIQDNKFTHLIHNPDNPNSISNNDILSIFYDKYGTIWIGTANSLDKYDENLIKFDHFYRNEKETYTLSNNNIRCIYKDKTGNVYVGTADGLNIINTRTRKSILWGGSDFKKNLQLSNNYILSICEYEPGIFYLGTYGGGINKINYEQQKVDWIMNNPNNNNSLSNDKVWSLYKDKEGNLWVGTYGGLNKFNPKTNTFKLYYHDPNDSSSISNNYVLSIIESHDGFLWIGTDDGLNKFNTQTEKFICYKHNPEKQNSISNNTIWCITEDKKHILWIGTYGGGLNEYNPKTDSFQHYSTKNILPDDIIYGILEDDDGNLWMSSTKGIFKFFPQRNQQNKAHCRMYDISDGLQDKEFNGGAFFKSEDGELFFGGINGFNAFYPINVKDNNIPPDVAIIGFQIFNKEVQILKENNDNIKNKIIRKNGIYYMNQHITYAKEIVLSYRENVISFDFAALHFAQPDKNKFAYKMENFDEQWTYVDNKRYANYTNLDPGRYIFRVKACNSDGVWNEEGASLVLIIKPPFWKTWWFRSLLILVFLAGIFVIIKMREQKIQRQKKILEERVAQRTSEIQKQKEQIEAQRDEIAAQRDYLENLNKELEQQKEEITTQRDEIESKRDEIAYKNKNITASIRYAQKIQRAILPHEEFIDRLFPEHFIIYRPKDIVSGDFYWFEEKGNTIFFAVIDCTGHGVPGAFMSIISNNLINQTVNEFEIYEPAEILNYLHAAINQALFQTNEKNYLNDGMDISLCAFHKKEMYIEYAGAILPLIIIRNGELIEYKADKKNIQVNLAQELTMKKFTNNRIEIQKGDVLYMFSDGFQDQFGGKERKKFMKKNLKDTFKALHQLPMAEQKAKMEKIYEEWKGTNDQIDDVTILCIKI